MLPRVPHIECVDRVWSSCFPCASCALMEVQQFISIHSKEKETMSSKPIHTQTTIAPVITEVLAGDALTLAAAARTLPPHRGKCTSPRTLWRWHKKGVQTGERRVHLELARIGIMWCTSSAALARFLMALTPAVAEDAVALPQANTADEGEQAAEGDCRELAATGI